MHKQSVIVIVISIAVAAGFGVWKYTKNKKSKEVSLSGAIEDSDKSAKPSEAQCIRYSEDIAHHVTPDLKEIVRTTKGGQESICKDKFSVATLKCVREHQDKNELVKDLNDAYGCIAAYPRK